MLATYPTESQSRGKTSLPDQRIDWHMCMLLFPYPGDGIKTCIVKRRKGREWPHERELRWLAMSSFAYWLCWWHGEHSSRMTMAREQRSMLWGGSDGIRAIFTPGQSCESLLVQVSDEPTSLVPAANASGSLPVLRLNLEPAPRFHRRAASQRSR